MKICKFCGELMSDTWLERNCSDPESRTKCENHLDWPDQDPDTAMRQRWPSSAS